MLVTLFAGAVAAVALYLVFRAAQGRILRQTDQLLEATSLDPMTGTLNHGALVGVLAVAIEAARQADGTLGIALLDIDNFRNLNETYGHPAGDQALTAVADAPARRAPGRTSSGAATVPTSSSSSSAADLMTDLEPTIELVRTRLADLSLQFEASERLPITISAGICTFPINGESVTTLLSTASRTLDEARASGGDSVRVAPAENVPLEEAVRFDVLEGLIIAVDTKDHYTRRHSEDVARYAGFLAEQLGLDEQARSVDLSGRPPPRHRQDRDPRPDPAQARGPDRAASTRSSSSTSPSATSSSATCPTSTRSAPASATTTNAGTGRATCTASRARTSRRSPASSRSATPSRR